MTCTIEYFFCEINRLIDDLKMVFRDRNLTCRAVLLWVSSFTNFMEHTNYLLFTHNFMLNAELTNLPTYHLWFSIQMPNHLRCLCLCSKWHFYGIPTTAQRSPELSGYHLRNREQQWFAIRERHCTYWEYGVWHCDAHPAAQENTLLYNSI